MKNLNKKTRIRITYDGAYPPETLERVLRICLNDYTIIIKDKDTETNYKNYAQETQDKKRFTKVEEEPSPEYSHFLRQSLANNIDWEGKTLDMFENLKLEVLKNTPTVVSAKTNTGMLIDLYEWYGIEIRHTFFEEIFKTGSYGKQEKRITEIHYKNKKLAKKISNGTYNGQNSSSPTVITF